MPVTDDMAHDPAAEFIEFILDLPADHTIDVSRRDRAQMLSRLYALRKGPAGDASRWADHPAAARLRWILENSFIADLVDIPLPSGLPTVIDTEDPAAAVAHALRWLAAHDRLPAIYRWVARDANADELTRFLSFEGGPDAGFDDLVAACQVGLTGAPKLELARNYWDEMGAGDISEIHTEVHARMARSLDLQHIPDDEMPVEGLERGILCDLLAMNHWLQPECLGALGLIELQAGPRCRQVIQGLRRTQAPDEAFPFYKIHADVDPRHGRDWVDNAVVPLVTNHPDWAPRIVRGAWWRSLVNARFFEAVSSLFLDDAAPKSEGC